MWINPRLRAEQPAAPVETGRRLATFRRSEVAELRVVLDAYEGHEYVGIRLWERNQAGAWLPTRKGVSVRPRELSELVDVLGRLEQEQAERQPRRETDREIKTSREAMVHGHGSEPAKSSREVLPLRSLRDRARQRPPVDPNKLPKPGDHGRGDFDEFHRVEASD